MLTRGIANGLIASVIGSGCWIGRQRCDFRGHVIGAACIKENSGAEAHVRGFAAGFLAG